MNKHRHINVNDHAAKVKRVSLCRSKQRGPCSVEQGPRLIVSLIYAEYFI